MILIINNQQVNLQGGSGRPNWTFRLKKKIQWSIEGSIWLGKISYALNIFNSNVLPTNNSQKNPCIGYKQFKH